ncbi:MAG: Maf family protein [Acidobacteriota bacterium]
MRLVLASASPRRAELLSAAGFSFDTLAVEIDESVRPGEHPATYVRRLALEKSARAQAILLEPAGPAGQQGASVPIGRSQGRPGLPEELVVLGADTTVVVGDDILLKPRDPLDAARMLRRLSGRRHVVLTGVSLRRNHRELGGVETTAVDFVSLNEGDVEWYRESGEGLDKAGGYAIQGLASRFISRIEGSYANVVGLPVCAVTGWLERLASAE